MSKSESRDPGIKYEPGFAEDLRKNVARAHRGLDRAAKASTQTTNPQTPPSRFLSSTFSSPGSIIGKEDDAVIIELSQRYLLAGVEGESHPQCKITFNPDAARRVGDYRVWLPGHWKKQESLDTWGDGYELWRNDVRDLDLGVIGDRLERAVREAYNKHLLMDAGETRLVLVVPSVVPHPVLETMLFILFERWKYPTITLLPVPTMAAISAGLRSALVIDIGWEESTVTSVYEYRELKCHRSTRAMREVTRKLAIVLKDLVSARSDSKTLRLDLDFIEQLLARTMPSTFALDNQDITSQAGSMSLDIPDGDSSQPGHSDKPVIGSHEVEWPSGLSTELLHIPKSTIADVMDQIFLAEGKDGYPDDEEMALPELAFKALLALSPDQRSSCMSRIVFVGEASQNPWIRSQVLSRLESLVNQTNWSSIKGEHIHPVPGQSAATTRGYPADARHNFQPKSEKDYFEDLVRKQTSKKAQQVVPANIREVESLGSWAGASLLTSLRVRGFVEVERERFLSHGLAGASRDAQISVIPQPQRISSFGLAKSSKGPDRTSWTLAGWG